MQHQAARGGEHFGLTNGFKRSGPLSKQCMILFGMNYMLLCAQSIQGATTAPEIFYFIVITALWYARGLHVAIAENS